MPGLRGSIYLNNTTAPKGTAFSSEITDEGDLGIVDSSGTLQALSESERIRSSLIQPWRHRTGDALASACVSVDGQHNSGGLFKPFQQRVLKGHVA
jgi:hypothetical protein